MKLICNNCKYEWEYNGKSKYYTCCPRCRYNVKVKDNSNLIQVKGGMTKK